MDICYIAILCLWPVPDTDDETVEQKDEQFEKEELKGTSGYCLKYYLWQEMILFKHLQI